MRRDGRTEVAREIVEEDTLHRAQRGDGVALEVLLRAISPRLLGLARRLASNPAEAEELVEEALYRGGMKISKLRDPNALGAWFRSILVTAWRDQLRGRRRRRSSSLDEAPEPTAPPGDDPLELGHAAELRDRLARAVASLPPTQRVVVALRFEEGLDVADIALVLGSTAERVKANLWHGRKRLRRMLGDLLGDRPVENDGRTS